MVTDMPRSLRFYTEGLGFTLKNKWTPDAPDKIRWCWLELGGAALMLQEYNPNRVPKEKRGEGVSLCFHMPGRRCPLSRIPIPRSQPQEPFVGNHMWDTLLRRSRRLPSPLRIPHRRPRRNQTLRPPCKMKHIAVGAAFGVRQPSCRFYGLIQSTGLNPSTNAPKQKTVMPSLPAASRQRAGIPLRSYRPNSKQPLHSLSLLFFLRALRASVAIPLRHFFDSDRT